MVGSVLGKNSNCCAADRSKIAPSAMIEDIRKADTGDLFGILVQPTLHALLRGQALTLKKIESFLHVNHPPPTRGKSERVSPSATV